MPGEEVKMPELKNWKEYIKHYPNVKPIKNVPYEVWKNPNPSNITQNPPKKKVFFEDQIGKKQKPKAKPDAPDEMIITAKYVSRNRKKV